jgi:hypothetical protein
MVSFCAALRVPAGTLKLAKGMVCLLVVIGISPVGRADG